MRPVIFITFLILCGNTFAQSWCAPGATWRYDVLFIHGYIEYYYASDTVINGHEAQVIRTSSVLQYPQPPPQPPSEPFYSDTTIALITRNEGDLVFQWSSISQTWDTLFWWAAQVGEGWTMAHGDEFCEPFVVLDTGTLTVDGVELRWLDLNNVSTRVVERIGSLWEFVPFCPPGHVDGMGGLRCYTDDEIHYTGVGWNYGCTSLVGVGEIGPEVPFMVHPNPGNDHFVLQLTPGTYELTLFDAQGRSVLRQGLSEDRPIISTSFLPSGPYLIHITDRDGHTGRQRWVKQ